MIQEDFPYYVDKRIMVLDICIRKMTSHSTDMIQCGLSKLYLVQKISRNT